MGERISPPMKSADLKTSNKSFSPHSTEKVKDRIIS